ncbi:MAG TPA: SurA N-terminal domain-containing protein [Syntrophales bacterium]|nr:SurA N-terminal domain-containing protein [Syntrophales bacterium]
MLDLMRKHAKNWLVKILLAMVIIVFIFYFGSTRWRQKAEAIATIDGKVIPYAEFHKKYQNLLEAYRQQYKGQLTDELLKSLNLKQQAYDSIINEAIIMQKAKDMGIEVSEEEVKGSILSSPAFQRNGMFDERLYNYVLRQNKMTPADFEDGQRMLIATVKLENLIQSAVKVSDKEVLDFYRLQNEKINVNYLSLSPKSYVQKVHPSRAELEAFLRDHENAFGIPEEIQVKFISFPGRNYLSSVTVPDAEAADYYERNKDKFMRKGKGKVSPLAEVKGKIVDELKQIHALRIAASEAKKAHDEIYQRENFDEYAAKNGLKAATTNFFSVKNQPAEFKQAADFARVAFGLQKDEIGPVISDDKAYYVLKLIAKRAAHMPTLGEVEKQVESKYVEEAAENMCKKDAADILARLRKGEDFTKVARERGLKVEETGLFTPASAIPKLGPSKDLNNALIQLSEKSPYPESVYDVKGNFIIVRFKERGNIDLKDFESKKAAYGGLLLRMKRGEVTASWIVQNREAMIKDGRLKFIKDVKDI